MNLPGGEQKFFEALSRLVTPSSQEKLEAFILSKFFERMQGAPYEDDLRKQFGVATPVSREMTGAGFYLNFHLPDDAPPLRTYPSGSGPTELPSVRFTRSKEVGMFMLWFENGRISSLEGVAIDRWPDDVSEFEVIPQ